MATKVWSGGAPATVQVSTITPSALSSAASVINVKLTDYAGKTHSLSYTTVSTNLQMATSGIASTATDASTGGAAGVGWRLVAATSSAAAATLAAATAGQPFTLAASIASGPASTQTAVAVANVGPNIFSTAENWVGDAAPVAGDSVIIPAEATDDIYGEDFTGTKLNDVSIDNGCGIDIGAKNKYLQLDLWNSPTRGDVVTYGDGTIYLDVDEVGTFDIRRAGANTPSEGDYALSIQGVCSTNATAGVFHVRPGSGNSVSLAGHAGEVMELNSLTVYSGTVLAGGSVTAGDGSAAVPANVKGGNVLFKSAATVLTQTGGVITREGSAAMARLEAEGGALSENSSGTVNSVNVYARGTVDATNNTAGVTHSEVDLWPGATYLDPYQKVTQTDGVNLRKGGLRSSPHAKAVSLDLGTDIKLTRAAVS